MLDKWLLSSIIATSFNNTGAKMVTVYFESKHHSEVVAVFNTEEEYMIALPELEVKATAQRMVVTESIED